MRPTTSWKTSQDRNYIHCANRPVQPDEDATRVFDFVECPRCKVKLIGWAIRHIMSLETRI